VPAQASDRELIDKVRALAMGLGEGVVKDRTAVDRLIEAAGNRQDVLRAAREELEEIARRLESQASSDEAPPAAAPLLAARLVSDAIEDVRGRSSSEDLP
jgi:hypothetical protein